MSQQAERRRPVTVDDIQQPAPKRAEWLRALAPAAVLVAAWALVVVVVGLGGDHPLNDDWAYAFTAQHFRATGTMRILDWVAPSLIAHAAWGAALMGGFGEGHHVLRAGTAAWGGAGLLLLYAFGRRSRFTVGQSLFLAAAVGLSPWYVNLAFTFMTDIPWLVMLLAAMLIALGAERGQPLRLVAAGTVLGLAALSRQLAVICAPGFLILIAADAFNDGRLERHQRRFRAVARGALFALPVVVIYGAFHLWYTRGHGPTLANQHTWQQMLERRWWRPFAHALAIGHYFGLWALPLVAAALVSARTRATLWRRVLVSRRLAVGAAVALATFAVAMAGFSTPAGFGKSLQATMPYLCNVVYLIGAGPLTIADTYNGRTPGLHDGPVLGYLLSALTTLAGVAAALWIGLALRDTRGFFARARTGAPTLVVGAFADEHARSRARLLVIAIGGSYLAWQLGTAGFIFDRYILVVMPFVVWIALDRTGPVLTKSPVAIAIVAVLAVFAVGATREYLAWNGARDRAVRGLEARGVSPAEIDGGFEVNGARHYQAHFERTGKLISDDAAHPWWVGPVRYRLSFWPATSAGCRTLESHPYWTWPGVGPRAIHVLDCGPSAAP